MTARRLRPPVRPVTPAGQVAAMMPRIPQGHGTWIDGEGRITGYRERLPYVPFAQPYVYGAPRPRWALDALAAAGLELHEDVHAARARRAAGQQDERKAA